MGESGMSKWIIQNVELIKKTYVVEAYGEPAAKLAAKAQAPDKVETIGEMVYDVTAINEYEYNKDWVDLASGRVKREDQKDWVGSIEPVEISEGQGSLVGPDKLKGPALNEIW